MLDTNICIYIIKQKPAQVLERFKRLRPGDVCISSITYYELAKGIEKNRQIEQNREKLAVFHRDIPVLDFSESAAQQAGKLAAVLEQSGQMISFYDVLIAAHALTADLILVTNNLCEFERIAQIKIENWV